MMHFDPPTLEARQRVLDAVVSKSPWSGALEDPSLKSLALRAKRPGSDAKFCIAKVETSNFVKPKGLYIEFGEAFEPAGVTSAGGLVPIIRERVISTLEYGKTLAEKVFAHVE